MTAASAQTEPWPALRLARLARQPRVPFWVAADDNGPRQCAGSVAQVHLAALARWPHWLRLDAEGVTLAVPAASRNGVLDTLNRTLRAQGLIVAWRDETYPVHALTPEGPGALLATLERAASRFWGTATFGAHCNGHVVDASGRPTHLWIARRADTKPTDPGLLDNLIGGGVPHGQSPAEAVVREGWEEAGLQPAQMAGLRAGHLMQVARDIPEGFQLEWLSVFDLALPADVVPANQDGEVQAITRMTIHQALAHAAAGDMTVDAALATLDFALRHQLLPADAPPGLAAAAQTLTVGRARLAG